MPYLRFSVTNKDIAKIPTDLIEFQEPRGTVGEFFTKIREKIVSGVGGLIVSQENKSLVSSFGFPCITMRILIPIHQIANQDPRSQ